MRNILFSNLPYPIGEADKLIDLARSFNSDKIGMEFFVNTYDEDYMQKLEKLPAAMKGMPVSFHGPFIQVEATSKKGTPDYDILMDAWKRSFELCGAFGVYSMVFHYTRKTVLKAEKAALQTACLENIEELVQMSKKYGVEVLIENLPPHHDEVPLFDISEFMGLFDRFTDAACIIDTGHVLVNGWSFDTLLPTLNSRIKSYHLHNNDGMKDSHNRIHDGIMDAQAFAKLFRKYSPDADCVLEYNNHGETTLEGIREDTNWIIKNLL